MIGLTSPGQIACLNVPEREVAAAMLERARNRAQDHYTGNEEAMRGEAAAAEAAKERQDAARRAREETRTSLGERIHDWWSHRFHRS